MLLAYSKGYHNEAQKKRAESKLMLPVSFYALQGGLMFHVKAAHELSDRIIPGNTKFMAGFNQGLNPLLLSFRLFYTF